MARENLLSTLQRFENLPLEESAGEQTRNTPEDLQTIKNDINRTDFRFSKVGKSLLANKLYLYILERLFIRLPIPYFQGMIEISTVILDAYLQDRVASFRSKHKDADGDLRGPVCLDDISENDRFLFEKFIKANAQTLRRFEKALENVLRRKFLVLTNGGFKAYNEHNKTFVSMMKSCRNIDIDPSYSIKYMNHTLTFFKRLSGNGEVVFKLFNLILNSDSSIVFCILAVFFDKAESFSGTNLVLNDEEARKVLIYDLPDRKINEILEINERFLKYDEERGGRSMTTYFFGVAASFLAIALVLKLCGNRERNDNKS